MPNPCSAATSSYPCVPIITTDRGCDFGIARHEGFFESRARGHQDAMIRIFFLEMGNKNPRISKSVTGQPAVEIPKRVPDRQTGQPSFILWVDNIR